MIRTQNGALNKKGMGDKDGKGEKTLYGNKPKVGKNVWKGDKNGLLKVATSPGEATLV